MLEKLKNRSVQTILLITLYAIFAPYLTTYVHQSFYTVSIFIKDMLMLLMPITVGVFIASTIDSFEKKAPLFILVLILFEGFSNLLSVWYSYGVANIVSSKLSEFTVVAMQDNFLALWRFPFSRPSWWGASNGSIIGVIIGCISALKGSDGVKSVLTKSRNLIEIILTQIFSRLIPLFVLGFIAQIYVTGMLGHMIMHYSILVFYLLIALVVYIFSIFLVGNMFKFVGAVRDLNNLIPAGAIALTSGCSLSTMPWTIQGTEKNLQDPKLAKALIPATTNIQQIADCIVQTFLCFLIYRNFFGYSPDILTWSAFSLIFVATRFATAAVLGGAIFLMLPIYQHYLNFNDEMIAIIMALNVILDPIITSGNVIANGGLAKIFENVWRVVARKN